MFLIEKESYLLRVVALLGTVCLCDYFVSTQDPGAYHEIQTGPDFPVLLSPPAECCGYRSEPRCWASLYPAVLKLACFSGKCPQGSP